jgi:hypothetical protein
MFGIGLASISQVLRNNGLRGLDGNPIIVSEANALMHQRFPCAGPG